MALNGKYVSIKRVLDGVYRDYPFTHELDWVDAVEWIGECLDLIACPKQYVDRLTDGNSEINNPPPIVIKDYRGSLPCDFLYPIQARDHKTGTTLRYSSDSFHRGLEKSEANLPTIPDSAVHGFTSSFNSQFISNQDLLRDTKQTDLTYTITDCHIFTNYKEGCIEMAYKAFPTDLEGLPMIPDDVSYINACKHYIGEKIMYKQYLLGKVDAARLSKVEQQRDWFVGKANSAAHLPTMDQMEMWKNEFVRLIPNIRAHDNGFKYLGDMQQQRNVNSY